MIRPGVIVAAAIVALDVSDAPAALAVNAAVLDELLALLVLLEPAPLGFVLAGLPPFARRLAVA